MYTASSRKPKPGPLHLSQRVVIPLTNQCKATQVTLCYDYVRSAFRYTWLVEVYGSPTLPMSPIRTCHVLRPRPDAAYARRNARNVEIISYPGLRLKQQTRPWHCIYFEAELRGLLAYYDIMLLCQGSITLYRPRLRTWTLLPCTLGLFLIRRLT